MTTTVDNSAGGIIERALSSQLDGSCVSSVQLLQLFANSSFGFIGELGFGSMLFRCTQSLAADFKWIPNDVRFDRGVRQLTRLDSIIQAQDSAEARRSRRKLLSCFVEFLTLMIGERATVLILRDAFERA